MMNASYHKRLGKGVVPLETIRVYNGSKLRLPLFLFEEHRAYLTSLEIFLLLLIVEPHGQARGISLNIFGKTLL